MNNPDNVGGLLPCPFCGCAMQISSSRDWHRVVGDHDGDCLLFDADGTIYPATDEGKAEAIATWNRRELCRAAPAGGDWHAGYKAGYHDASLGHDHAAPAGSGEVECYVREVRTWKGSEFFVVVKRDGRELTPHMYIERWKAEYDVASWQHLLCGAPEPDILAYGPSDDAAPVGSMEIDELAKELCAFCANLHPRSSARLMCERAAALLRKLQQGADGWRPIESAPKDGSYVLVANSHGSWIAKWHPVYQSGYRPSNPWASMMLNHDHIEKPGRFDLPTQWRPIPHPAFQDQEGNGHG